MLNYLYISFIMQIKKNYLKNLNQFYNKMKKK